MSDKVILVTGATGKQGQAVVQHALARGFKVRALTRSPEKPSALALKAQGVEIAQGDMENVASLRFAMTGVYGVFCTQNYWEKGVGLEGEIRQGRNVAQAAAEAQVTHFVHSSVAGCDRAPWLKHFAGKWEIEKIVDSLSLPRTFLRSVFFMENFLDPQTGPLVMPVLAGALKPTQPLHMIAANDIGWFAAEAFANPQTYLGRAPEIAGDCLTVAQMKQVYRKVIGSAALGFKAPLWLFRLINGEVAKQFVWNNQHGWHFDVEPLRRIHPQLIDFETFLRRNRTKIKA
jgi:uncharacterized protein YbjT (DUF2867 family)